jgi:hypothetical protein
VCVYEKINKLCTVKTTSYLGTPSACGIVWFFKAGDTSTL